MIKKGDLTVLGTGVERATFMVIRIEDGYAHLKDVVNPKGRPRKMKLELVPYFTEDGTFVIPKKPTLPKFNRSGKLSLRSMIKEYTDMPISRDFVAFLKVWMEGSIEDLVVAAEENAESRGDKTITPAHMYWWEMHPSQDPNGYWPDNSKYMEDL